MNPNKSYAVFLGVDPPETCDSPLRAVTLDTRTIYMCGMAFREVDEAEVRRILELSLADESLTIDDEPETPPSIEIVNQE